MSSELCMSTCLPNSSPCIKANYPGEVCIQVSGVDLSHPLSVCECDIMHAHGTSMHTVPHHCKPSVCLFKLYTSISESCQDYHCFFILGGGEPKEIFCHDGVSFKANVFKVLRLTTISVTNS